MKNFLAALALLMFLNFGMCSAENIHAIGRGNTERSAIHNAMRAAIEQKFGAAVNAKTRTQNSMLISDKVSVDSAGLISSYEILSSRVENGIYIVEISAELNADKISPRLSDLQKKSLVDVNADNPRVAVIAFTPRLKTKLFPRSNVKALIGRLTLRKSIALFSKEFIRRRATLPFVKRSPMIFMLIALSYLK